MIGQLLNRAGPLRESATMLQILRIPARCILLLSIALLPGCGSEPPGVKVTGQLLKDGEVYTPPQGDNLSLSFSGKDAKGEPVVASATVDTSTGSFVVHGPKGRGVPPGKYTVQVSLTSTSTDPASLAKMGQANKQFAPLNGKEIELSNAPDQKITIDIAKGTVSQ